MEPYALCPTRSLRPIIGFLVALSTHLAVHTASAEPIVYQGRFTQNGQVATQTRALRFELFDQPTGGSPLATFEAPSVSIVSGLFTVPLDFPDASFEGTPRYLQITVLPVTPGDATQVLSRQLLGTTPRADSVRGLSINQTENVGIGGPATNDRLTIHGTLSLATGQGLRFPDGSIQSTAADTPPAQPGVVYPGNTRPVVDLSGEAVTLVEPLSIAYDVVENVIPSIPPLVVTLPGTLNISQPVVRRPFTGDPAWRDLFEATVAGSSNPTAANSRTLRVRSVAGGVNDCTLTFTSVFAAAYRVVSIGSQTYEDLILQVRNRSLVTPVWGSGATGNGASLTGTALFTISVSGVALNSADIVQHERGRSVIYNSGAQAYQFSQRQRPECTFRTPFGANPALGAWMAANPGPASGRQRMLALVGPAGFSVPGYESTAWITAYRLLPAPDGALYEEWTVTSDFRQ